jgi:hypothetical protein
VFELYTKRLRSSLEFTFHGAYVQLFVLDASLIHQVWFSFRDFVSEVMHNHDGNAFALRDPTTKHILRVKKFPIGIHARWAADGHDKLYKIGFPIWAIIEDATGKWLGGWVVPSNRTGNVVAYLWLCTVEKHGG